MIDHGAIFARRSGVASPGTFADIDRLGDAMRRLQFLTRDDLRLLKDMRRCFKLEMKWTRSNDQRRADTGHAVLTELTAVLASVDGDSTTYIADPEDRLILQHSIGMIATRVALDLGRPAEARKFASAFNRRFQLLVKLAMDDGQVADKPKMWKQLSKFNNDRYAEVMAVSIEG
jgi:hypothetical protein